MPVTGTGTELYPPALEKYNFIEIFKIVLSY